MQTKAGTSYYMAPEVIKGNYDNMCDFWSIGVILYIMVSSYVPFIGNNTRDVFKNIIEGNFHFNHMEFEKISDECKDLISNLLVVDPKKRIKGKDILKHPWLETYEASSCDERNTIDPSILLSLQKYRKGTWLKRASMEILVKMVDQRDIANLRL